MRHKLVAIELVSLYTILLLVLGTQVPRYDAQDVNPVLPVQSVQSNQKFQKCKFNFFS